MVQKGAKPAQSGVLRAAFDWFLPGTGLRGFCGLSRGKLA